MKKHLMITCMSYAYFGFGLAVNMFGIKAGMDVVTSIVIWVTSWAAFMVAVFTSMEKIKRVLFHKDAAKLLIRDSGVQGCDTTGNNQGGDAGKQIKQYTPLHEPDRRNHILKVLKSKYHLTIK